MSAQSYGTGIHVYAAFTGGSGAITLGSGDALTVSENGGAPVALVQEAADGSRGPIHYTTTLPRNDMPADVVVAFTRAARNVSAPRSEVIVPAPFEITSTPPAAVVLGDPLSITIAPAPQPAPSPYVDFMSVATSGGACTAFPLLAPIRFDSQGNATLDTSKLFLRDPGPNGCDVTFQIRHETRGPYDPAFAVQADTGDAGLGDAGPRVLILGGDSGAWDGGVALLVPPGGFEGLQARSTIVHFVQRH